MTLLELIFKLPQVECEDGYTYFFDNNRNVTDFFDTENAGEAFTAEGEHFTLVIAHTEGGDAFTFALPYQPDFISPKAIKLYHPNHIK